MAWRDDKARATLIREAAGSMQPGKTPRAFAELLFDHTNIEDLASYDAASLAFLAEQAWEHVQQRTTGSADIRVINPMMPDGREISVLEVLNDNMPFLFDSTMAELAEQGIEVTLVVHPVIAVERDEQGKLLRFFGETLTEGAKGERESLIHFHIARLDADADRQKLIEGVAKTLNDVRACVTDWQVMRARVEQAIKTFNSNPPPLPIDEVAEANQFLQWLCADNFTFLGLREYRFSSDSDASDEISTGEGLGILRGPDVKVLRRGIEMVVMTSEIREFMREPTVLIVIKANVSSRVHRRVRMDYVGIKLYTPDGRIEGELRLVGLFTSGAYTRLARQIPYVRHKVAQVLERAGFEPDSHSGKAVQHILEEYPRDELFQVDAETLYNFVMEILMLYERPRVRALARADKFDRFVSILVFIPREKYDTDVRTRVAAFLAQVYKGTLAASYTSFPEGSLARVHYIIGRYEGETPVVERATLEAGISAIAATWSDKLKAALATSTDGMRARMLANRYARAFTGGYTEAFGTSQAIADIATIEKLTPARPVAISVYRIEGEVDPTRFGLKVFSRGAPLSLSYRVPVIENHGLRVVNERTYQVVPGATPAPAPVWLHDMTIEANDGKPIVIGTEFNHRLEASIMAVVGDRAESDGYNALILRTALGWREISAIRALSRYLRQIRAPFSQDYMWETLRKNTAITTSIVALFQARFDPRLVATGAERSARETAILDEIEEQLKSVASLDEDRILRRFTNLVQATIRTNLWQIGQDGHPRPVISFKFEAHKIEGLPHRGRSTRFSSIHRVSKAFICASARWRAAACAGPTGRRISAPRSSAWSRHSRSRTPSSCRSAPKAASCPNACRCPPIAMPGWQKAPKPIASSFARCSNSPIISMATRSCRPTTPCGTMAMTPISSSPPTRALPPFPTPPTRSRPRRAIGSAMLSPPAAARAMTTRRWASPRAERGKPSNAISASSAPISRPCPSPRPV
jgi:glutamate dehydrogenase